MKRKKKPLPRFITIKRPLSEISWFNGLIGNSYQIKEISEYGSAEIEYLKGHNGWVPLECCELHYFRPTVS